jgi:DNA-directed RNA polymerase alpha subunit
LMKIKKFGKKSVEQVLEALQKRFLIKLPKNKLYFH